MKPFAVILVGISILIQKSPTAMSQEPSAFKNMTCYITSAETNGCTGIPTLQSGVLAIAKEGTFTLKAQYHGCFMVEQVTKSGRFQLFRFTETMSLELLTTKTTGIKDAVADFPRTLGFANLNYDRLDGYFVDISAVIRGYGRHTEMITTSKLQCE
ncbi:hypothetical protein [Nitrosomonas sp.]|uniref:hypothetical protein n=1 Tax=Nitrosomonas sp. TaxID=42353 RepID=UPI00374CA068